MSDEPRRFTVVFRQEGDEFCEPVHVHFEDECPACLAPRAGTSLYGALWEESPGDKISCSECDQEFVFVSINIPGEDWGTCEIETVGGVGDERHQINDIGRARSAAA